MLVTLIPLFDENMAVSAYSLFTQKKNYFLNPSLLGTGQLDGASRIGGLELLQSMGIEALAGAREVFVQVKNISLFSDIVEQSSVPRKKVVLLLDNSILPEKMYVERIRQMKEDGYKLAIRKLDVSQYEEYKDVLKLMDYILLDCKKIDVSKAKLYFNKVYPKLKVCAGNIDTMEQFEALRKEGGFSLYEGQFFRMPINEGEHEVAPLKVNYIQLLNMVNSEDFELTKAADVIGRDTALVIALLKMVNRMTINSQITSIRHAAAMLGEKELKKWITTAVTTKLCTDKPNEVTRLSLLRAKFAENLAPSFSMALHSSELFLMGLFSVLDVILDMPMEEALNIVTVSKEIKEALIDHKGDFGLVLEFIKQYESANWQEVSRLMIVHNIEIQQVYDAYVESLSWYRKMILEQD